MKILLRYFILLFVFGTATYSYPEAENSGIDIEIDTAIKELDRHITVLEQFNTKNKQLKLLPYKLGSRFLLIDDIVEFTHDLLRICIKKMMVEESLDPLFVAWRLFVKEYKTIDSHLFLHEMTILLFSIYKNIFVTYLHNRSPVETKVDLDFLKEMVALYQRINSFPIKELLRILDRCLDQFLKIMQDCGMNEGMSWIEWLKKYWWVPPVIATSVLVGFVKMSSPLLRSIKVYGNTFV